MNHPRVGFAVLGDSTSRIGGWSLHGNNSKPDSSSRCWQASAGRGSKGVRPAGPGEQVRHVAAIAYHRGLMTMPIIWSAHFRYRAGVIARNGQHWRAIK